MDLEIDDVLAEIAQCTQLGISPSVFAQGKPALRDVQVNLVGAIAYHAHIRALQGAEEALPVAGLLGLLPPSLQRQVKLVGLEAALAHPCLCVQGTPAGAVVALTGAAKATTYQCAPCAPHDSDASSTTVESPRSWQPASAAETRVVKLRGLPFHASQEAVQLLVDSLVGPGTRVALLRNRDGRSSGFAHVHCGAHPVAFAQRALHLARLEDRYLEATVRACERPERRVLAEVEALLATGRCLLSQLGAGLSDSSRGTLRRHGLGLKGLLESAAYHVCGPPGAEVVSRSPWPVEGPCVSRLRLRGLPFSADEADVVHFVHAYGHGAWLAADPVRIQRKSNGRPTGIAVVHLAPGVPLNAVLDALDGKHMGERYIEVFAADDK